MMKRVAFSILAILFLSAKCTNVIEYKSSQGLSKRTVNRLYFKQLEYFKRNHHFAEHLTDLNLPEHEDFCALYYNGEIYYPSNSSTLAAIDFPPSYFKKTNSLNKFTIYCFNNIDNDSCLEVWSVDHLGNIMHIQDDIHCSDQNMFELFSGNCPSNF